jgi:hypothetical protein
MPISNLPILARGCLCAVFLIAAACSPRRVPPMTVSDLMEDRVTLDGVMLKCNQNPEKARTDIDCLNARIAAERLASQREPAEEAKRAAEFERNRELLRMSQEKQRQEQESKTQVDAYHLPVVPVDPPPAPAQSSTNDTAPDDGKSPALGRTNP